MNQYFSIGELARYQNISKQTLIYYDKIGLFHPAFTDPENGYRYYSSAQIDYLDTILIMKRIGFSLKEIQEHMRHHNIDTTLPLLKKQLTVIDCQIQELQLIKSRVRNRCEQMEQAQKRNGQKESAVLEELPSQSLFFQKVDAPYTLTEISLATKKCFAESFQKKLPTFFQCGVIVPLSRILERKYTEASFAFLPIETSLESDKIQKMPSGTYASIFHVGSYPSIGESYERLLAFCRKNRLNILSDSYEFCVNDYLTSSDEEEYITKIMFRVAKKAPDS